MGEPHNPQTNITSHGQTGGITAHTVNVASPSLSPGPVKPPAPKPWWKTTWKLAVSCAGILVAIFAGLDYFHIQPKEKGMPDDPKHNITSYFQSGGITAHTVNVGVANRTLSDPQMAGLKAQILRDVPKTKPVTVIALMGDTEAYRFAAEIHAYMQANGFRMTENGISQGVIVPPPIGLGLQDKGDHFDFIVGSKQ
jgi:hypothetical protein